MLSSRQHAQAAIDEGRVLVGGAPASKHDRLVAPGEPIVVIGDGPRFVSRGGEKLEAALDALSIDVDGLRVVDCGASTGGFTDCLLQRGAGAVVAVDVGHGQLHERVARDSRVTVMDRTNVRHLTAQAIGGPVDLVVADLSFISVRTVATALVRLPRGGGALVVLVKPQFEAGRAEASRGKGVIRDPAVWARTLDEAASSLTDAGAVMMGAMASPLKGADGNTEFFIHLRTPPAPAAPPVDLAALAAAAGRPAGKADRG